MSNIRTLSQFDSDDFQHLSTGYTSDAKYRVRKTESDEQFSLALELVPVSPPYLKRYDPPDPQTRAHYQRVLALGFSLGAYEAGHLVGIALAEPRQWNGSLWVWELHVAEPYRRKGIGRALVGVLAHRGRAAGLRTLVCETQNTNVPAIRFYRSMGFQMEGVDLSYYSNEDFPDGEIALFMKKRLG